MDQLEGCGKAQDTNCQTAPHTCTIQQFFMYTVQLVNMLYMLQFHKIHTIPCVIWWAKDSRSANLGSPSGEQNISWLLMASEYSTFSPPYWLSWYLVVAELKSSSVDSMGYSLSQPHDVGALSGDRLSSRFSVHCTCVRSRSGIKHYFNNARDQL